MAKERKASVIYEGNGTQQTFSFPFDYLRKAFVKAEIIESSGIVELEQGKDYSITDKELTLNSGVSVATGKLLKIYRETTTDPLVEWQDASVLRSADLSLQEVQLLHLAEETVDKVFDTGMSTAPTNTNVWDGQYKRITNLLDPQEDGDAVTLRYVNDKQHGLLNALKSEGAKQNSSIVATGNTQNTRLTNTGNSYVSTMTTLKTDTTTKANEAKESATSASSSASTATTKANEAKKSATSASSSASTATTKANEAKNSVDLAKKWAMSDSSPDGVSGNKSSKTWANEAKNSATSASSSASTATTKANEAKNSASAAAKSAENAKTWDPTSYIGAKSPLNGSADGEKPIQVTIPSERGIYPLFNGYPDAFPSGYNRHGVIVNLKGDSGPTLSLYALNESGSLFMRSGWGNSWNQKWYKLLTPELLDSYRKDNSWLFDSLHRLGQNYKLPTTNNEIAKLGVFSSFYNNNNTIPNQPTRYGQLINIPADNYSEVTQLWLEQPSGKMYHRGGNAGNNANDNAFKRFLDTDDYTALQNKIPTKVSQLTNDIPVTSGEGTRVVGTEGTLQWYKYGRLVVTSLTNPIHGASLPNTWSDYTLFTGLPKPIVPTNGFVTVDNQPTSSFVQINEAGEVHLYNRRVAAKSEIITTVNLVYITAS